MSSSLLTAQEVNEFQNAVNDHFETFKRLITVHKAPTKVISLVNEENQALGYNNQALKESVQYTPRNATFYAIIQYNPKGSIENISDIKSDIMDQVIKIKVKQDARDYIMNDKTERITFDDKVFKLISNDILKNYQGLKYYNFYLELVN